MCQEILELPGMDWHIYLYIHFITYSLSLRFSVWAYSVSVWLWQSRLQFFQSLAELLRWLQSRMKRRRSYQCSSPHVDVAEILCKHEADMKLHTDFDLLLRHIMAADTLLTLDELDQLGNKGHFASSDKEKTTRLFQFIIPHGERGLRVLIAALKDSGESAPHLGHSHWAEQLQAELDGT